MKLIVLATFLIFATTADCETLSCTFDYFNLPLGGWHNKYTCILTKVTHLTDDPVSIAGSHTLENYNDDSVQNILVSDSNTKYIIPELFTKFPNAEDFELFNSKLSFVQSGAFRDAKNIITMKIFHGNNVTELHEGAFDGLVKLEKLYITTSNLQLIGNGPFKMLQSLKELSLLENRIVSIAENAFEGLEKLTDLDLSKNYLTVLEDKVFHPLVNVKFINLDSNKIQAISGSLFEKNVNIKRIDMSDNEINAIESTFIDGLIHLWSLSLSGPCVDAWFSDREAALRHLSNTTCFINFENKDFTTSTTPATTTTKPKKKSITLEFEGELTIYDWNASPVRIIRL